MTRGWRLLWGGTTFLAIVLLTIAFLSYRLLTRSLPQTKGRMQLTCLTRPVQVYRDAWGVPHIFAENEADLFRAAGFVTAQDRLWQMDFTRRVASGRLSEILGEAAIEDDKFLRLWGFRRIAGEIAQNLSPESRLALEAYCEGVNGFIESDTTNYPIEFSLLGYKPEKWQVEDSIALTRLMAWKLSFSWFVDPVLNELVSKLGTKKAKEVFPDFPERGPYIIPPETRPFWTAVEPFIESGVRVQNLLGIRGASLGSNAWVVSGAKTACGKPILANDPHLELVTPSVWYELHLAGGDFNVAGVALPGVPGIVIGHNQEIAWGLTNGMVDDVDFYFERVNPDNPNQYWDGHAWVEFRTFEEKIFVKDAEPISLELRSTKNGIVVSGLHAVLEGKNETVAMRWVGQTPSDELAAYLKLTKAENWADFTAALRDFKVPAQNFVFASRAGDIGYYLAGTVPIRNSSTGILPHQGWLPAGQWVGEVPFEHLPHLLNPEAGYIATANNKIVDDRYPYYLSNLWEPSGRSARIHEWFAKQDTFTADVFKMMQQDIESAHARTIMSVLRSNLQARVDSTKNDTLRILFNLVKDWKKGVEAPDSVAVSIYHAFLVKVAENTLEDEMGAELYSHYIKTNNVVFRVVTALLKKEESPWFDDVNTEQMETKADILARSLLDAADVLQEIAGENIANWRWGEIHTLTMPHPLGVRKPLDFILNLGPYPRGGSTMTINNGEYRFREPFNAVVGPSTRQVVDLCDLQHTFSIITSGQSGQRMDKHYKDQTPLWLNGEYHEMVMDPEEIEQTAPEFLVLRP
ncbi:MAG: penicillin acylase family protein [bacterium]